MNLAELNKIAKAMVAPGRGILAADESSSTIKKRFDAIGIESTADTRAKVTRYALRRNYMAGNGGEHCALSLPPASCSARCDRLFPHEPRYDPAIAFFDRCARAMPNARSLPSLMSG